VAKNNVFKQCEMSGQKAFPALPAPPAPALLAPIAPVGKFRTQAGYETVEGLQTWQSAVLRSQSIHNLDTCLRKEVQTSSLQRQQSIHNLNTCLEKRFQTPSLLKSQSIHLKACYVTRGFQTKIPSIFHFKAIPLRPLH